MAVVSATAIFTKWKTNMHHMYLHLQKLRLSLIIQRDNFSVYNQKNKYIVGSIALNEKGKKVAVAFNSYTKTHPRMKELGKKVHKEDKVYLHAEIGALIKAKGKAKKLVVARLLADNTFAISKPCPICMEAIRQAEIDEVYYTDNTGNLVLLDF
jgi:tRNA(Arg) A34 adenosine deaminase TadA